MMVFDRFVKQYTLAFLSFFLLPGTGLAAPYVPDLYGIGESETRPAVRSSDPYSACMGVLGPHPFAHLGCGYKITGMQFEFPAHDPRAATCFVGQANNKCQGTGSIWIFKMCPEGVYGPYDDGGDGLAQLFCVRKGEYDRRKDPGEGACVGNPLFPSLGVKKQFEFDFQFDGFGIKRTYNSKYS